MDRLTKPGGSYCDDCGAFSKPDEFCKEYAACRDEIAMYDRLAAYEDTGLEPEEILKSDKMLRAFIEHNRTTEYPRTLDWLLHITKAESEGRLIVRPGAVYQTDGVNIYESTVRKVIYDTGHFAFDDDTIGRSVFLTREEAEAALGGDGDG